MRWIASSRALKRLEELNVTAAEFQVMVDEGEKKHKKKHKKVRAVPRAHRLPLPT